jgi:hypothetical protein
MANIFIGSVVGAVLGVLALREIRNSKDERGHNFATAAVAISAASILLGLDIVLHNAHAIR